MFPTKRFLRSAAAKKRALQSLTDVQALVFDVFGSEVDWRSGASRASAALRDRSGLQVKSGRVSAQRRSTDAQDGRICFVAGIIMTWRREISHRFYSPAQGARTRSDSPGFTASFTSPSAYGHPACHPAVGVGRATRDFFDRNILYLGALNSPEREGLSAS
jgi:hypothetical protein